MLSISQAAQILGVSLDTLRDWDESGRLRAERSSGGHRRYQPQAIVDYLAASGSSETATVWRKLTALGYEIALAAGVEDDVASRLQDWQAEPTLSLGLPAFDRAVGGGFRRSWFGIIQGKSGTLKSSWGIQTACDLAARGERVVLCNLEMRRQEIIARVIRAHLRVPADAVPQIVYADGEQMQQVRELLRNMQIVGWEEGMGTPSITAQQLELIVLEAVASTFSGKPVSAVIVDHLGLLRAGAEVPRSVRFDELLATAYQVEQLWRAAKSLDVLMLSIGQLPKAVPPGLPFAMDAGRGSNKATDYPDFIINFWLPEHGCGLDSSERAGLKGVLAAELAKNRHGPTAKATLRIDYETMRLAVEA
jgi:excisionase family DNA binding protein